MPEPDVLEHDAVLPVAAVERVVSDDADCAVVDNEPRPAVPRPAVPSPLVPRPAAATGGELAGVAPELADAAEGDEATVALDVVTVPEFAELTTPEVLTELHGTDAPVPALEVPGRADPEVPGRADMVEFGERLMPPPSKVVGAAVPGFVVAHGATAVAPEPVPVPE